MINQLPDLPEFDDFLDSEALTDEGIELSPEQIDQAAQLSQPIFHPTQQWQIYLHGLAFVGFEQWLDEWASDLNVNESNCSILQPPYANLMDAVCHLQVGRLDLCLIATPLVTSPTITLPRAVIDLPQFVPHVYVLVEVQEEHMQVQLYGYLRRDQMMERRQSSPLKADSSWVYSIPLNWFNANPADLLIELRHLDPESLPSIDSLQLHRQPSLETRLRSLLPQLQSPDCLLSQLLTWEEGAALLSNPELVNWVYQMQRAGVGKEQKQAFTHNPDQEDLLMHSSSAKDPNSQSINVGHWLNDCLDAAAQKLGWMLLPPLSPAAALRSAQEELAVLGVQLPPEARGAYEDLQLGTAALRLHAFTWMLSATIDTFQWTLLIVLGAQPHTRLPAGIRLQIRDQTQLLYEQILPEADNDSYLYAQVGGEIADRFWVTINLPDGAALSLPPFIFHPDS